MKLRNYLETISGVGVFPVITLSIFFLFFTLLAIWAVCARKEHLSKMNRLPLLDESELNHSNHSKE